MYSSLKTHPALKIVNNALRDLPTPSSIHSGWNFGSLLGLCLLLQISTGVFLAMHYSSDTQLSFLAVNHIGRDVNSGWLLRVLHANGASAFFICLYCHLGRGLYFGSFRFKETWGVGVVILLLVMAAAFMGYVLPWGQMSFWGATVITNLFSALPYIGLNVVNWIWGGFAVDNATLTRFFAFHFLIPIVVAAAAMAHLLFLHQTGSSNPLGLSLNSDKTPFHPYFSVKDLAGFFLFMALFFTVVFEYPWTLGDPENFIPANPLVTPVHIQPEWYFLFAYAILRSIPNKLGGVVALAMAVMILFILPFFSPQKMAGVSFYPPMKIALWILLGVVFLLTWIGARPVEEPYVITGQVLTGVYFLFYFSYLPLAYAWEKTLNYHSN